MSQPSNTKKEHSFEIQGLFENIEKLIEEAEAGKNEAQRRLKAIKKLANPVFDFSYSDCQRILDKKLPLPVKKGIELYKMMKRLTPLVQPIGQRKGAACSVRLVDYENITWDEFLDLRGTFSAGFVMKAMEMRAKPKFNGMDMLDDEQKQLYQRIKVYFGKRKKPTLKSLAMNLLQEESDGNDFSERSIYIYLKAVGDYQKRRSKAAGFDVLNFTFHSVTGFNNEDTIRESLERMNKVFTDAVANLSRAVPILGADFLKNITAPLFKNLVPQFQFPKLSDLMSSAIPKMLNQELSSEEETKSK